MENSTAPKPRDPNDTSNSNFFDKLIEVKPIPVPDPYFNRECRRYAKKHGITLEEAFKRLYK